LLDAEGNLAGDPEARSRLASLARFALGWYGVAAGILCIGLAIAGVVFFSASPAAGISWFAPWLALCVTEAMVLMLLPLWSILEGCGQVRQVYGYRLVQVVLSSVAVWLAILSGAKLWTAPFASSVVLLWAWLFLGIRYGRFFRSLLAFQPTSCRIRWRQEIWPLQWRIALSWMCGYLSFFLFTPVLFQFHGPKVAGQMGMTWSLVGALSAISTTWVMTRVPRFGALISAGEYAELDRLALRLAITATCVAACGAVVIEALLTALHAWYPRFAARMLPQLDVGLFLLATILLQAPIVMACYLRAHKREPLLRLSMISGLLSGLLTVVLGREYGSTGVGIAYLSVTTLISVPLTTLIWHRCRTEWHKPEPEPEPAAALLEA
jgi:hypothetical protein